MEKLIIEHNHGMYLLKDVEMSTYEYTNCYGTHECYKVRGTVEQGYSVSRLFQATHTRHETPGEIMEVDLYGRKPYQRPDGTWFVSIVFCG